MRRMLKNQKGLTMMEVLLTVALLAIVIVPCLSSFVVAQRGNVLAAQTRNEYTKAQNLMEELKACADMTAIEQRLSLEYELNSVKVNATDGIHAVYTVKTNYIEINIYVGEGDNRKITTDDDLCKSCDLILKGVIAP